MAVRVQVNRSVLTRYLQRGPEPQAALKAQADELKGVVDERAEEFKNTGHYAVRTFVRKFRFGYQVINGDTFSFIVEYGSVNNPPYRAMTGSAVKVFGDAFHEQGKEGGDDD
jgi:hypothetical protein